MKEDIPFKSDKIENQDSGDGGLYFSGDIPRNESYESLEFLQDDNLALSDTTPFLDFFTSDEYNTLVAVCGQIIPSDDNSPGAIEANVPYHLDRIITVSTNDIKINWQQAIKNLNEFCFKEYQDLFFNLNESNQINILEEISKNEFNETNDLERAFSFFKKNIINIYYRTPIGIHIELGYKGNSFYKSFNGCE